MSIQGPDSSGNSFLSVTPIPWVPRSRIKGRRTPIPWVPRSRIKGRRTPIPWVPRSRTKVGYGRTLDRPRMSGSLACLGGRTMAWHLSRVHSAGDDMMAYSLPIFDYFSRSGWSSSPCQSLIKLMKDCAGLKSSSLNSVRSRVISSQTIQKFKNWPKSLMATVLNGSSSGRSLCRILYRLINFWKPESSRMRKNFHG